MTDWAKLKVVDLKAELKRRDLPLHGLKAGLVARLTEADEATAKSKAEQEAEGSEKKEEDSADAPAVDEQGVAEEVDEPAEPAKVDEPTADATQEAPQPAENGEQPAAADATPNEEAASAAVQEEVQDAPTSGADEDAPVATEPVENEVAEPPAEKPETGFATDAQAPNESTKMQDVQVSEDAPQEADGQKRKRRSPTPSPSEEAIARKRARADEGPINGSIAPAVRSVDEKEPSGASSHPNEMDLDREPPRGPRDEPPPPPETDRQETAPEEMEFERDVPPSVHKATTALYIKNFMRPLRPDDVRAYMADLASPPGGWAGDDVVTTFFLDQIRTHAFVVFASTAAAARVRAALHGSVWPNESNRKPLWVDFVPAEKVQGWIDTESGVRGRSSARWEVIYEDGPDGLEARLEPGASATRAGPPPASRPLPPTIDANHPGPRHLRDFEPPSGPRGDRAGAGRGPVAPPPEDSKQTRARPSVYYKTVSPDLARRRIENMRSFYAPDAGRRDLGREINRYSFENGDSFVDRGKEVFEGIRPPHRERGRGGGGGGGFGRGRGGRGGGGRRGDFRQRSDRYLPGREDRRGQGRFDDGPGEHERGSLRYEDDQESFRRRDSRDWRQT